MLGIDVSVFGVMYRFSLCSSVLGKARMYSTVTDRSGVRGYRDTIVLQ